MWRPSDSSSRSDIIFDNGDDSIDEMSMVCKILTLFILLIFFFSKINSIKLLINIFQMAQSKKPIVDTTESTDSERPLLIAHYLYIQVCFSISSCWDSWNSSVKCDSHSLLIADGILWKEHFKRHNRPWAVHRPDSAVEAVQGNTGRFGIHSWAGVSYVLTNVSWTLQPFWHRLKIFPSSGNDPPGLEACQHFPRLSRPCKDRGLWTGYWSSS